MSGMRRFLGYLALVVAAFALPGLAVAQGKNFDVSTSTSFLPAGTHPVTVTFHNSGSGNSVINSLTLQLPTSGIQSISIVSKDSGTATINGSLISIVNLNGVKVGKSFQMTLSVTVADGTPCQPGQFTGRAWTGNTLGGTEFTASPSGANVVSVYVGCDGTLDCGADADNNDPTLNGTPLAHLTRGSNTSGQCVKIPYTFHFVSSGTQTATFLAIKNGQSITAEYVMAWNPVDLNGPSGLVNGWPAFRPQVSWGIDNPQFPADYVPAPTCLTEDITNNPASIMPTMPDDCALPPADQHYCNNAHGQFQPNQPAQMCIAEHNWAILNVGTDAAPVWKIQYLDVVIDQSDGRVTGP